MSKSSIHIDIVKPHSEAHNTRTQKLDYVFADLSHLNDHIYTADRLSVKNALEACQNRCKEITGRAMQKNAHPIREAIINLNANHRRKDILAIRDALKKKFGITVFQAHIHRDEGKSREEINYHAHLLMDIQDKKTGKTIKFSPKDLSQMQTLIAETLGMDRGELKENSNRERLEAVEYKRVKEEERMINLQNDIKTLEEKKKTLSIDTVVWLKSLKTAKNLQDEFNNLNLQFQNSQKTPKMKTNKPKNGMNF
jgi:hypothetical protein